MPCIEKWECRAGEECYNQANPKKADHIYKEKEMNKADNIKFMKTNGLPE